LTVKEQAIRLADTRGTEWVGRCRAEVRALLVCAPEIGDAAPDRWQLDGAQVIDRLGPASARVRDDLGRELVLKRIPGDASPFKAAIDRSRARRAYRVALRLLAEGIATPEPVAYLERSSWARSKESFLLTEYCAAPSLGRIRDAGFVGPLSAKRALIRAVASVLQQLRLAGVVHGDPNLDNFLVDGERVLLLDLESIRRIPRVERATLRNLVRLNRDFLDTRRVSRTDRLRFLRAYLGEGSAWKALYRRIAERTARKLEERGEAFF
jgi:tRNA A-37 threonylcarbamoyl transferase component Bud32